MNIELGLLAVMLKTGDFGPIAREEVTLDHFQTNTGQTLFGFIRNYKRSSDGAAIYPSLKIVKSRFDVAALELPEPDPSDNVTNLTHELKIQKHRADLRALALDIETVASDSEDPTTRVGEILAKLRQITEIQQRVPHMSLARDIEEIVADYKFGKILPAGIPWPWPTMTEKTKGLHKKEFIVIAGRPKSRKTFTALRIAVHAVKYHHKRVLVFTPEMPVRQVFLRCIAHLCDLPYTQFKDAALAEAEAARLFATARTYGRTHGLGDDAYQYHLLEHIPGLVDTYPSLDIVQSTGRDTSWLLQQIELYQPDIVVFDSFYRQRAQGAKKNDSDWKAVTSLSREMKDLVMEAGVVGIGTHQMNRGADRSAGDLSGLALADAIGADADGIWRVATGKIQGEDVSALYGLGNREVDFDGVLIRNKPCYDYSEIGLIKDKQQVLDLMKQEEEAAKKDQGPPPSEFGLSRPGSPPRRVVKLGDRQGAAPRPVAKAQGRGATARKVDCSQKSQLVRELEEAEAQAMGSLDR